MKEGATTYIDWRNSVDELVQDKVGMEHIKSLVLQSLEGPPKDTARLANKRGKGTLTNILLVLDKAYGQSASYVHLQSELCNIQQMYKESAQDYFERMVRLQVVIQDKYPTQLKDAKLKQTAQEAYFNGLRDEFKLKVAYMLDNPGIKVTDLVEAVRHIEAATKRHRIQRQDASYYPASTSAKPVYQKDQCKDSNGKHNHNRGVINAKLAQIESNPSSEEEDPEEAERQRIVNENAIWWDGYYMCAATKVDDANMFYNMCYNCREPGHRWRDCSKPLRQGLQDLKDRAEKDDERLNGSGGGGDQGGRIPRKGQKGARPAGPAKPQK